MGKSQLARSLVASYPLHKKFCIIEADTRTHLWGTKKSKDGNRYATNAQESVALLARDMAQAISRGSVYWYYDLAREWYNCPEILDFFKKIVPIYDSIKDFSSSAEIAFIADWEKKYHKNIHITMKENYFVDERGFYGEFGGAYVPEILYKCVHDLQEAYLPIIESEEFKKAFHALLKDYVGRPSPLYFAKRMSERYGCQLYLKREDLNHTGAHKINNTIGQILLAKQMGKTRIIAETGAGQHGVATATVCALMNMKCEVFMGATDVERQPSSGTGSSPSCCMILSPAFISFPSAF